MLFVLTMTCVYVVGDYYAPLIANQNKSNSNSMLAQQLSYSTGLTDQLELKDVSEFTLAENTTAMGKTSKSLSESFDHMSASVKNKTELDSNVNAFKKQIVLPETKAIEKLSKL